MARGFGASGNRERGTRGERNEGGMESKEEGRSLFFSLDNKGGGRERQTGEEMKEERMGSERKREDFFFG